MDLIRIFTETAFVRVADRYLNDNITKNAGFNWFLMIDEAMFVDECRIHHPELTDDHLRLVYAVYRDEWSSPADLTLKCIEKNPSSRHIFNIVFKLANELLRCIDEKPVVKFHHLFRWREISQLMGNDFFACALLAFKRRNQAAVNFSKGFSIEESKEIDFVSWPTVLHNDNPDLEYIFKTVGLCELHSHLFASTDVFNITWVCLMNHISGLISKFEKLAMTQDPSRYQAIANRLYRYVAEAAAIRLHLWQHVCCGEESCRTLSFAGDVDVTVGILDESIAIRRRYEHDYDYIASHSDNPMNIFEGERLFMFAIFERILRCDDIILYELFYRYILIKNRFRSFFVQVNDNKGFNNFKRFQDLKSVFLKKNYLPLLKKVPLWEANHLNHVHVFETRIVPGLKNNELFRLYRDLDSVLDKDNPMDWSLIFHFIKVHDRLSCADGIPRDFELRTKNIGNVKSLKRCLCHPGLSRHISGIDAASSEMACRPEAFAQIFRYLKTARYSATFHAGEDFYDIADGLRAIFEAITFLELDSRDRLGHAIALGIDAEEFYRERHSYIILPAQWMLDNVVWAYFFGREHNAIMDSQTENFLLSTAKSLMVEIGYGSRRNRTPDLFDYYQSMMLRGDSPEAYREGCFNPMFDAAPLSDGESWSCFYLLPSVCEIREGNPNATALYSKYHFDDVIKERGQHVKSFKVPTGYVTMITDLQNHMIKEISRSRLGIECCPSSNLKIGRLHRFDCHPIFRFMPVRQSETRHSLAVTVNTDDLGIFATSLPNEYSLLALALLKKKDQNGNNIYTPQEVYDWIRLVAENGHKFRFVHH